MLKFFLTTCAIGAVLITSVYLGNNQGWMVKPSCVWETVLFPALSTLLVFWFLTRFANNSFIQAYLASIVFKLLVNGGFILIIIFLDRSEAAANAVLFILSYFVFTALEIGFLFNKFNR